MNIDGFSGDVVDATTPPTQFFRSIRVNSAIFLYHSVDSVTVLYQEHLVDSFLGLTFSAQVEKSRLASSFVLSDLFLSSTRA